MKYTKKNDFCDICVTACRKKQKEKRHVLRHTEKMLIQLTIFIKNYFFGTLFETVGTNPNPRALHDL